jgi:hypothetical protein
MGREAFHAGLRDFLKTYVNNPDHPVIQDLLPVLRKHAPDEKAYDDFVQQWFCQVVAPEYKVSDAISTERLDGSWDVTFRITNVGSGRMPLCVAATTKDARINCTIDKGEVLTLAVRCPFKPDRIVPDPDVLELQLNRKQAVLKL